MTAAESRPLLDKIRRGAELLPSEARALWLVQMQVKALLEQQRREQARAKDISELMLSRLFPVQKAFVLCKDPEYAALCTRRAGKSYGLAAKLISGALETRGSLSLYVGLSRPAVEKSFWPILKEVLTSSGVKFETNETKLTAFLKNGSKIWVAGCPDKSHVDTFRGPPYKTVTIDETQSHGRYIKGLINDVLRPALMDLHGQLILAGTPGMLLSGFWYDVTTGGGPTQMGMPTFEWSLLDNPHIPDVASQLAKIKDANRWTDETPTYVREYLGRWVEDRGSLVYNIPSRARVPELPRGTYRYVLAIDLGSSRIQPTTAFVVAAYGEHTNVAYIVEAIATTKQTTDAIAKRIRFMDRVYRFESVVADTGGLGGAYVDEINTRHNLRIRAAAKSNKEAYIEMFNSDIEEGHLQFVVDGCADLLDQADRHAWVYSLEGTRSEDKSPNHLCDGALYAWREARHYEADDSAERILSPDEEGKDAMHAALLASAQRRKRR